MSGRYPDPWHPNSWIPLACECFRGTVDVCVAVCTCAAFVILIASAFDRCTSACAQCSPGRSVRRQGHSAPCLRLGEPAHANGAVALYGSPPLVRRMAWPPPASGDSGGTGVRGGPVACICTRQRELEPVAGLARPRGPADVHVAHALLPNCLEVAVFVLLRKGLLGLRSFFVSLVGP